MSHTSVTRELEQLVNHVEVSPKQLKSIIVYGFKREYVRSVINHYDMLAKKHGIAAS